MSKYFLFGYLLLLCSTVFAEDYCKLNSTSFEYAVESVAVSTSRQCDENDNIAISYNADNMVQFYEYISNRIEQALIKEGCNVIERDKNSISSMLNELKLNSVGLTKDGSSEYGSWENAQIIGTISISNNDGLNSFSFRMNDVASSKLLFSKLFYKCRDFSINDILDEPVYGYEEGELPKPETRY